jgi:NAD(P)-dependent dehydrogenase (short-subunit alcohol dehydrogenase family)
MHKTLQDKVAIVTGAGRGIGRGIAVEFAKAGAKVVVASRGTNSIDRTVGEIEAAGGIAIGVACNVADPSAIQRTIAAAAERFGRLDILVNNAQSHGSADKPAPTPALTPFEEFRDGDWDHTFATGPTATYRFMKAAFPLLKASGAGRVINFGSFWGQIGYEGAVAYDAAKEAIRGLSRTAAREWGKYGITVNVINPMLQSDSMDVFIREHPSAAQAMLDQIPMRRFGDIFKDGGRFAVYLAGPEAGYLTGMTFQLDGGMFMSP